MGQGAEVDSRRTKSRIIKFSDEVAALPAGEALELEHFFQPDASEPVEAGAAGQAEAAEPDQRAVLTEVTRSAPPAEPVTSVGSAAGLEDTRIEEPILTAGPAGPAAGLEDTRVEEPVLTTDPAPLDALAEIAPSAPPAEPVTSAGPAANLEDTRIEEPVLTVEPAVETAPDEHVEFSQPAEPVEVVPLLEPESPAAADPSTQVAEVVEGAPSPDPDVATAGDEFMEIPAPAEQLAEVALDTRPAKPVTGADEAEFGEIPMPVEPPAPSAEVAQPAKPGAEDALDDLLENSLSAKAVTVAPAVAAPKPEPPVAVPPPLPAEPEKSRLGSLKFFCRCGQKILVRFPAPKPYGRCPRCGHRFELPEGSFEYQPSSKPEG